MPLSNSKDLSPSPDILQRIFGETSATHITILSQNKNTCVFHAHLSSVSYQISSSEVVVLLEKASRNAAPERSSRIIGLGRLHTESLGELDYVVEEFIRGNVWG
jgi:hypothetical protein